MLGLDYAGSSPGAAAVKAAGYGFVARYLSRYAAKTIRKPEYDDMTGNGVGVVLVFEDYASQALNGYDQGVADAQVALGQANALGWPSDRPIHFAVDFDISDAQKPIAGEYMKGAASVLGLARTGAYGGYWWIKYCADNNLAAPNARWQAVAWSGGQVHPSATLFQRLGGVTVNGTSCDVNEALKDDYGQNNGVSDMSQTNLTVSRILAFFVGGRVDPENNALNGNSDGDLNANHIGEETNAAVWNWYTSGESQAWLNRIFNLLSLESKNAELQTQLDAANAKVKELQDQANSTPAPDPTPTPTPDPTPTPTPPQQSFWDWLKSIFKKK